MRVGPDGTDREEFVETFDDWKLIFAEPDSSPLPGGRSTTSHTPW